MFHHEFALCDAYRGGEAAAAALRCPVTMVLGSHDQMTPPRGAHDFAATVKARVVMVDAGHNLMAQAPDAVLNALRQALN